MMCILDNLLLELTSKALEVRCFYGCSLAETNSAKVIDMVEEEN